MQHLTSMYDSEGQIYDLPDDKVDSFREKRGGERAYDYRLPDGSEYSIPESKVQRFAEVHPDATPVRTLSFAGGETRRFTGDELRKFFADEYVTSPKYKADRDEDDARRKAADEAELKAYFAETGKVEAEKMREKAGADARRAFDEQMRIEDEGRNDVADAALAGAKYGAQKGIKPYVKAFLTAPMRLFGRAIMSGNPMYPSLAGGQSVAFQAPKEVGQAFINAAAKIEEPFTPTPEEEEAVGAAGRVVGRIQETAQTIGAFAGALHGMGRGVGNVLMSAEAGNDTYLSLYDEGIRNGLSPEEANKWASGGSAVATLGTAALGALSVPKFMQMGVPELEAGATMGGFRDLVKNALAGNVKRYMMNTAGAAAWTGGILGAESLLETPFVQKSQGQDVNWGEAWWEAGKSFVEGAGIGLFMGGMNFVDYRRGVRQGIELQARQASMTDEGRAMWAQMFPEGTGKIIEKRLKGESISRADIEKAGYPEMSQAERNAIGDALVEQFAPKIVEAAKAKKAAEVKPTFGPAPYDTSHSKQTINEADGGKDAPADTPLVITADLSGKPAEQTTTEVKPNATGNGANEAPAKPKEGSAGKPEVGEVPRAVQTELPKPEAPNAGVVKPTELPLDDHGMAIGEEGDSIELENGIKATVTTRKDGSKRWTITQGKRWTTDGGKTWHDGLKPGDRFTDEDFDAPDKVPANVHFNHQKNDSGIWEVDFIRKDGSYELKAVPAAEKPSGSVPPNGEATTPVKATESVEAASGASDENVATPRKQIHRDSVASGRENLAASPNARVVNTGKKGRDKTIYTPTDNTGEFAVNVNRLASRADHGVESPDNMLAISHLGEVLDGSMQLPEHTEDARYRMAKVEIDGDPAHVLLTITKKNNALESVEILHGLNTKREPAGTTHQNTGVADGGTRSLRVTEGSISEFERVWQERFKDGMAHHNVGKGRPGTFIRDDKPTGDIAADLANTSEADIDRMFSEALGEKESGEIGGKGAKPAEKPKTDEEAYRAEYRRRKEIAARMAELAEEWGKRTGQPPQMANFGKAERVGEEYARLKRELQGMRNNPLDALAEKHGTEWAAEQERAVDGESAPTKTVNKGKGPVPVPASKPQARGNDVESYLAGLNKFEKRRAESGLHHLRNNDNDRPAAEYRGFATDQTLVDHLAETSTGRIGVAVPDGRGGMHFPVYVGDSEEPVAYLGNEGYKYAQYRGVPVGGKFSATKPTNKGKGVKRPVREDSSSREVHAIAAQFGGRGNAAVVDAVAALHNLFGASDSAKAAADKLGMAAPQRETFDENVYNTAKPLFQSLLGAMQKDGKGVADFIRAVATNFGPGARQYLKRFAQDLKGEQANGQQGATSDGNGLQPAGGGHDRVRVPASVGNAEDAAGGAGQVVGAQGADGTQPAASSVRGGGGEGNGVSAGTGQVAGNRPGGSGGRNVPGSAGNSVVSTDADGSGDAKRTSLVHSSNGNIDTRKSPPVRLTASKRTQINAQAAVLAEKPVGTLTDDELDILRQYTGMGGLGYEGKSLNEQRAALNQHFTSYEVIDAMWNALEKAGVPMQNVLEPSAGSGNFVGRRPDKDWTLVELDKTTAKILSHLYPGAKLLQGSYEDVKLSGLDLAISNVPFLEQRHHPDRPDIKNLHDYFFAKAIDQVKPNGVVAFITSTGTMNAKDPHVRQELVSKGDVIGAFRLPRGMFKANAGTEVTTDVIFIQRRPDGVPARPENAERNAAFVESLEQIASDGVSKMRINSYYEQHPEGLLGDLREEKDKMYGGRPKLELMPSDATDLSQIRIDYKPYPVAAEEGSASAGSSTGAGNASKYPHSVQGLTEAGVKYELSDGNATYSQNIRMYDGVPHVAVEEFTLDGYEEGTHTAKVYEPIGGDAGKKIATLDVISREADAFQRGDERAGQRGIEEIADYKKKYGVHPLKDKSLVNFFKKNGEKDYLTQLASLFDENFKPSDALVKQTRHENSGKKQVKWDAPLKERALAAEDTNCEIIPGGEGVKIEDGEIPALLSDGYSISRFEGGKPVLQNDVLFKSGNIYRKIDAMAALKAENPEYAAQIDRQIAALEAVKPTPRTFEEIKFNGLEGWHGEEPGWAAKALKKVGVEIVSAVDEEGKVTYSVRPVSDRILSSKDAELLGKFINGEKLVKQGKDQTLDSHIKELQDAELHVAEIYAGLRGLINGNEAAREIVERGANEAMNAYVPPDYTKLNHLSQKTFDKFKANGIKLRPNQVNWATKAFIEGRGLNAHDVGGGKTLGALALTDMLLDHGSAKKILISVPKQTFNKWVADARRVMPDRTVIDASGLSHGKTRGKVLAQIANADTQIVFTTHEGMGCIELSPEDEAVAMETYLREVSESGDRQGAKMADKLLAYMEQEAKRKRETRWTMDKLGIDCLIADEAHNFKNVGVSMSSGAVGKPLSVKGGVNQRTGEVKPYSIDSARSTDFRYKCDYITSHNNDRNVFLLTATPTPNSPLEIYTMLRHMGANPLAEYGIFNDRDFRRTFMRIAHRMTVQTDGSRAMEKALVKLTNVYALRDLMNRFIDRIPMSVFASELGIPLPETRERHAFVRMSDGMRQIVEDCKQRMENLPPEIRKGDDTLIAIYMDGLRAAAAEMGYEGPHAGVTVDARTFDSETDKLEWAADFATKIVREGNKSGGVPQNVILFCNTMAKKRMDRGGLSIHEEIKQALLARGFKPEEVIIGTGALMTDPATGKETTRITDDLKYQITQAFAPEDKSVKTPTARVIIASKIFSEGMNLQRFARAVVHIDQPLTNGEVIQRDGRAVRSGNEHNEVDIVHLFRTGSYDQLAFGLASTKKGWNEALWDKAAADELDVSEEFTGGAVPSAKQLEIEMIEDPVEKIRRRVEYQLEALRERHVSQIGAVSSAKESVVSNRMAIEERRRNADTFSAKASEAKIEKAKLEGETLPAAKKTAETSRGTFLELAKLENVPDAQAKEVADRISALPELREKVLAAEDKAFEVSQRKPDGMSDEEHVKAVGDAQAALAEERKAFGEYGKELTVLVNELPESVRATARSMRDKYEAVGKVLTEIRNSGDVIASNTRRAQKERDYIPSLEEYGKKLDERVAAEEQTLADVVAEAEAVRSHWYTKSGENGPEVFNVETASLQAEIEAGNKKEDADMDWVGTRQTLDMMPAPSATGAKPLNKGKLPTAGEFRPSGTEKPDAPMTRAAIFRAAQELFPELRIANKGTWRRPGVLGWLEVENRVLRTVDSRAIGVLSHELGHAVSRLAENKVKMPRDARTEFITLGIDLYGSKRPAGGYASEGFAEFVRGFLCDYDLAKDYPNAHKWFFEDFGGANPDFIDRLFALKGKIVSFANMAPEHGIRALWDHKLPVSERDLPWYVRARRYFGKDGGWKTDWVDSNYPILRAMRGLSVDYNFHDPAKTPAERAELILNHPYMLATFFQGSALRFAEVDALENTVDLYGEPTGDGLMSILQPIVSQGGEKLKQFWDYAVAMRGADYAKKGIEFGATRSEIAAAIAKYRSPEFKAALDAITDWNHRILHLLVDGGVIDEKQYRDICDANPVYVPMMRVFAENEINRARQKRGGRAIFKRKGDTQEIEHPLVAMIEQAARIVQAAQQGKVIRSLVDMYDRAHKAGAKDINRFMVEMTTPVERTTQWAEKIKEQIANIARARFGTDEATIKAAMADTWTEELFSYSPTRYRGKGNIVTVNVPDPNTGRMKLRTFEVSDPAILKILGSYASPEQVTATERTMQWLANGIRMGATVLKGSFSLVANPIRDTMTAFHMNEYGSFIPFVSSIDGMVQHIANTDLDKAYFNMAGDMGRFYNGGHRSAAKEIAGQIQAPDAVRRQLKKGLFNLIGQLFSIPEIGPRLVAFRNAKNYWESQGVGTKAANMLGRLCGGDITIDFGRAGGKARRWNRYLLFLNAAIRELDQLARASGLAQQLPWQNPGEGNDPNGGAARASHASRFWRRGAALTALALVAYALNNDNEKRMRRWRELKPEYKWNNIVFDFGDEDGESPAVRLPVPFIDGLLFMSAPVAFIEAMRTGDGKPLREVAAQMGNQLPFSPGFGGAGWYHLIRGLIPSAATPITDLIANENWSESQIVPERLNRLDARDQYTANTTEFAKMMGGFMNVSPAKFEYLYDQYTGGLVSGTIRDLEHSSAKAKAIGVSGDLSKIPILGRLFLAPFTSSRLPGDFYKELDGLSRLYASGRSTPEQLGKYRAMEKVASDTLSEFSKSRRAVMERQDIPADEVKRIADGFSKQTIDTIRDFNEYAKGETFRDAGITSAVAALCNPATSEQSAANNRLILERGGVDLPEAQQALRRYGKAHGWSSKTLRKRSMSLRNRW